METGDSSGLIQKIKHLLIQEYSPAQHVRDADFHYTTMEMYQKLQELFPSDQYGADDVAVWLHDAGFTFKDFGDLRFEWLMKRAIFE